MSFNIDPKICTVCRGRGWCGLSYCPLIARRIASLKLKPVLDRNDLFGSSPPSVFVGRYGYPYVNIGPSAPPERGDTRIYDYPENWIGLRIEDILEYRWSMVTGATRVKVIDVNNPMVDKIRELTLSIKPVDVEIYLEKPPKTSIRLSEHEPPQGPRAPLRDLRVVGNPSIPRVVDRVYSDRDLKAIEAVLTLYNNGIPVSMIQKLLSIGALGKYRKLVPTRWSITAVDSMVSDELLEKVKDNPFINRIEVYLRRYYDNLFIAILVPGKWSYEWMEAWWPGSTWNPGVEEVVVEGDHEGFRGRSSYPDIGGCYYATRLAVAEHLHSRGRQAVAIVLREIYPGFNLPLGVWFVRENIRAMFREKPLLVTDSFREVLELIDRETKLGSRKWVESSYLLKRILYTETIDKYLSK